MGVFPRCGDGGRVVYGSTYFVRGLIMFDALQGIVDWFGAALSDLANWFLSLVSMVVQTIVDLLRDLVLWVFDAFMGLASGVLSSIDLSGIPAVQDYLSQVPAEVTNVLGLLGLGQALGVIALAAVVRILLQLIPFTRLGS